MASFTVTTKINKNAVGKSTVLTINFDSPDAERALATSAAVVKLQGMWRKHGVPEKVNVNLSDIAPGTRHTAPVLTIHELFAAMSPAEKVEFLNANK